jgi:hypothetical protein
VDSGELPATTDPDALATFFAATIQGLSQQARDGATRAELAAAVGVAASVWQR